MRQPESDPSAAERPGLFQDGAVSALDVLEAAPDALVLVEQGGDIVLVNEPAEQLFGYRRHELLGKPVRILVPWAYRAAHALQMTRCRTEWRRQALRVGPELFGLRKDGTEFPVEVSLSPLASPKGPLVILAIRDISDRKRAEAERRHLIRERALYGAIARLARHDALTGLANRALLHDRLTGALASADRHGDKVGVAFLDLDRFKHVNDTLGHSAGDCLLQSVAAGLQASVRRTDTVGRQGGDEFVIVLPDVKCREDLETAAAKIVAAVAAPHRAGGHELHVTASIGIAVYPDDGRDVETLIRNADIAMYYAKDHGRDHGRDRVRFFTPEMMGSPGLTASPGQR